LLLPALSILLMLGACGGGGEKTTATQTTSGTQTPAGEATQTATATAPASGGEIDACALVTKVEAEAVVGEPLGDPAVTNTDTLSGCLYMTSDFKSVNVDVVTFKNEDDADSAFQLAIDINNYPEVKGIGDHAFDTRPTGDITVFKGKYQLSIDVNVEGNSGQGGDVEGNDVEWSGADFEAAKQLAAKAVDRLP